MILPSGYSEVPDGKLASVVTCLQMLKRPAPRAERAQVPWRLRRVPAPDPVWYQDLFRRVGADWLWFSRLVLAAEELMAILHDTAVEVYAVEIEGRAEGLVELDFRAAGECELAFYGLTPTLQGQGAGRWLMNRAIDHAWSHPIRRFWVHTCSLDHPQALAFYLRSGFKAYARRVEIADDPRLTGFVLRDAAAHIPLIEAQR